jgi:hypothetical protein
MIEGVGNRMIHPVIKGAVKPNPTAAINFVDDRYGWMQISGLYYR